MPIFIFFRAQLALCIVLFFTLAGYSFAANASGAPALLTNKTASIFPDAEAGIFNRRASLKRMGAAKYIGNSYQKTRSYDVLAATALRGCGPAEWPAYMASLSTLPVGYPPDGPVEMFSLPPLVRYLYQFGDCMTPAQKQKLLSGFTSQKQYLTGHGTINHAIMRATSWYLLAQYFPDAKWTHWDGKVYTSPQLMAELKRLMNGRKSRFYKSGQYEWLSPTYAMVNVFPLLNLIDFAADPQVQKTAEEEATLEVAVLRAHSFHGVIVPPLTRKNLDQLNATDSPQDYTPAVTQHLLWYYFGEPAGIGLYDFRGQEPFYATFFGLSNWLPSAAVLDMNPAKSGGYAIKLITHSFGIWDSETVPEIYGDSYIADDFAVGTGNQLFDPDGYSGHIQTFSILLKSDKPQNQIECYHPFWKSNEGEDAWKGDRSSPFQQMYRYDKSSVVMLFDIPKKDPWAFDDKDSRLYAERSMHKDALLQLAECRIARSFDEVIEERDWVFVRQGGVFVAMATLHGDNEYDHAPPSLTSKYLIVKVRQPRTALFFRVERETPEMNFAQFRERVRKQLPVYDASSSLVALTEQSGVRTQVKFKLHPHPDGKRWAAIPEVLRNGKPLLQDNSYVIDSPVLTLKNGVLTVNPASRGK